MQQITNKTVFAIYQKLFSAFGKQYWWPAQTPFEVMVGAILTQNTNWSNVEKALNNLRKQKKLNPSALRKISQVQLAKLIRPAGYFNVKSKRLKNFIDFFFAEYRGRINLMKKERLPILREKLLGVNGVGPETADSILLYALDKPIFVVDAYTKRILSRHGYIEKNTEYHIVQNIFMDNLRKNRNMFNEYHALIVQTCKEFCRTKPLCKKCPLRIFLNSS